MKRAPRERALAELRQVRPSMRKADTWPLSSAETALIVTLAYLVLLIGLAGARHRILAAAPAPPPSAATLVDGIRPLALVQGRIPAAAGCVTARTAPQSYATDPAVREQLAFGPPVETSRPLPVAQVNGELWRRLCGGAAAPGAPTHGPDRRLFVAIDAVVNGRDPNRRISRAEWAAGVDRLITHDALWDRARVVTRTFPPGTVTFGMRPRPGPEPLVIRTRLSAPTTSRYLVLPVRRSRGLIATLTLRLPCGFQPVL